MLSEQGGRCAVCQLPLTAAQAVLDHDHETGAVRGILHRGCNGILGKLENGASMLRDLTAFVNGVAPYLRKHATNVTGLIYSEFKTADEKRELRNARARKARATKKGA
jgi:hypothetical protein